MLMAWSISKWRLAQFLFWLIVAGSVCWWRGPSYSRAFDVDYFPPGHVLFLPDFFQEWASARNRFEGLPVYTPQEITVERYLGIRRNPGDAYFIELNAHPPTAVLLGVPFAALDFADAFALWNLFSLACLVASGWLIVEKLPLATEPWMLLPAGALLLLCHPFWHQMVHGQLNLLLLLLLTSVWLADREGHPSWAGALLGVATAIKLYPGFLFLYFLLKRDWPALRAGVIALVAITGLTALVLGPEAYRSYFVDILPRTSLRRADWHNLSLSGVWCNLLYAPLNLPPVRIVPLVESPLLAMLGMIATMLIIAAILAMVLPRLLTAKDLDLAFSLCMIAMLLVSPITWDHYLLVLALPLAVIWQRLQGRWPARIVLLLLLAVLCLDPGWVMLHGLRCLEWLGLSAGGPWWISPPLATLTALSIPCYALLGLFVLALWTALRSRRVN
jgi:hypothetical protein